MKEFCTISMLNVEGKVFLGILARRMTLFLLSNKYINTSIQKGGVPSVPGCIKHSGVIAKIVQGAKRNQGDVAVPWLDLTNAYATVPYKLVEYTLKATTFRESSTSFYRTVLATSPLATLPPTGSSWRSAL